MLYDPKDHHKPEETAEDFKKHSKLYERFMKIKQSRLLRALGRKDNKGNKPKRRSLISALFNLLP
jgi:hypothetical protein